MKSYGELLIANFLSYMALSMNMKKNIFRTMEIKSGKFYKPDFYLPNQKCFIEYFGIDENGNTAPFVDKKDYNDKIAWKFKPINTTILILSHFIIIKIGWEILPLF